ncbi:hypothetical protein CH367_13365 [Leptospira barantonii]|uniref:Transposase DDE domain-containing protein n=1 Tax=Leptospira barantonii TaxID=2023184 RepID=A0ABX4NJT6_9LEPT|nr:hypothetical protein CH367_13365 [Leptospira barantonii]
MSPTLNWAVVEWWRERIGKFSFNRKILTGHSKTLLLVGAFRILCHALSLSFRTKNKYEILLKRLRIVFHSIECGSNTIEFSIFFLSFF